jgi:hypothetical protein
LEIWKFELNFGICQTSKLPSFQTFERAFTAHKAILAIARIATAVMAAAAVRMFIRG